jgi:hypothetical protein
MATRLYLPSSNAAPISPTFGTGWTNTVGATRVLAGTSKVGSGKVSRTIVGTATAPEFQLAHQFIFGPLAAQTISGTVSGVVMCRENNAIVDGTLALAVRVVTSGATDVPVASELTTTPPEFGTGGAPGVNRQFLNSADESAVPLTEFACDEGDYLVIEIGGRNNATTTNTMIIRFGDDATDCAFNSTGTSDLDPWIEFTHDILIPNTSVVGACSWQSSVVMPGG